MRKLQYPKLLMCRQISLAYSRISISDIGKKLQLASDVETEYMVRREG